MEESTRHCCRVEDACSLDKSEGESEDDGDPDADVFIGRPLNWEAIQRQTEKDEMPLMPEIRNSVVFLYKSERDAKEDSDFLAIGFFLARLSVTHPNTLYVYLATNEHVIKGVPKLYARCNMKKGGFSIAELGRDDFATDAKFDLAICRFPLQIADMDVVLTTDNSFLEDWRGDATKLYVGPGDDVVMVSRLIRQKVRYKTRNLPILRFGNISLCPEAEESFFIAEMRSLAGHSGSPVWVYSFPMFSGLRPSHPEFGHRLLGMNRGHLTHYDPVVSAKDAQKEKEVTRSSLFVQTNTSMTQVIPAWEIKELLYSQVLQEGYDKAERGEQ